MVACWSCCSSPSTKGLNAKKLKKLSALWHCFKGNLNRGGLPEFKSQRCQSRDGKMREKSEGSISHHIALWRNVERHLICRCQNKNPSLDRAQRMYITIAEWKFLYNCSVQIKCLEPILDYVHLVRRLVNPNRVGTSEATRYVGTREIMNFKLLFCDGGRHLGQNLRPFWKVKIEVKILPQKVAHLRATTTAADASAATLKHTKERL